MSHDVKKSKILEKAYITASWPAPAHVKAFVSTRNGGVSLAPFASLNLGAHVGDDPDCVDKNRQTFARQIAMPNTVQWLNQVHGTDVAVLPRDSSIASADAAFTEHQQQVCAVLTADCLPVFFCDQAGKKVAVAHAGWRSLCSGVLEATLAYFDDPATTLVWLGPAIGPDAFEVGGEVRQAFIDMLPEAQAAFVEQANGKWLADLYALAKQRLAAQGVHQVFGGDDCTFTQEASFYSYRRDGKTGRMASVIWLEAK